jgi:hypothetical protein
MINIAVTPRGLAALADRDLVDGSVAGTRIRALAPAEQRQLADLLERVVGDGAMTAKEASAPEPAPLGH